MVHACVFLLRKASRVDVKHKFAKGNRRIEDFLGTEANFLRVIGGKAIEDLIGISLRLRGIASYRQSRDASSEFRSTRWSYR